MFEEAHEKLEGLRRLFAGKASPVEEERAAAHVAGCRECWLLANRAIAAEKAGGGIVVQGPLKALIELHEIEQTRLEEWLEAQAIWIEIKSMTPKARRDKVRLTRALHNLGFLEVLLEAGASASTAESEEFLVLALLAAQQFPSPRVSAELKNDLCAECCAEFANARRRLAKWGAVRDALRKAKDYFDKGSRSGVVEGKLLCVEAALEDDLGNSEESAVILRKAVGLFALFGFYLKQGQTSEAIAVCRRAGEELSLLDDEEGSVEIARDQMRQVWRSLEVEVKRGTVDLRSTVVLRKYIKAHWRFPADEMPAFSSRSSGESVS